MYSSENNPKRLIDASDSLQMAIGNACQHCSHLPPPPPVFNIGPPPNVFSIEARCSSRLIPLPSIEDNKHTSSSSTFLSIILGILIAFLITFSTIVLIKKQLVKRRKQKNKKKTRCDSMSTVMFKRHDQHANKNTNHHHLHQNWTTCIPLLSDSCSSDQTTSTPSTEYPCTNHVGIEPLLTRDNHHEYEQIKCDDSFEGSLHYYCLVYCRQCANYHPTSSSSSSSSSLCPRANLVRPCYLPLSTNPPCQHQCSCYHRTYYQRNDHRFVELQSTRVDNSIHIQETPPI